jgi:hypothetical protein
MSQSWPWAILILLGAYHGLNPAMGWLFALALGLQEQRRAAVFWALLPIALGHAAAIATALLILNFIERLFPIHQLKWPVAAIIFALGIYRLVRASHPRGVGMRVGGRDLFIWSFLMASAHGAGLMLFPVLLSRPTLGMHHVMDGSASETLRVNIIAILLATLLHTAAMLFVEGVLALLFYESYEKIGLKFLRHAWFNFDFIWAIALLGASVAVLFF